MIQGSGRIETYSSRGLARVGAQVGRDVGEERPVLQHGELGLRRGARGGAQDGDVLAPAARDLGLEPARLAPQQLGAARPAARSQRDQPRVVVLRHAAIVVVDDQAQARRPSPSSSSLSTCSSSSHRTTPARREVDQVARLGGEHVLVDAQASCSRGSAPQARSIPSSAGCGRSAPPPRLAAARGLADPSAIRRTWSRQSAQVYSCQMPSSFSRTATSLGQLAALWSRSLGNVSSSSSDGSCMAIAAGPQAVSRSAAADSPPDSAPGLRPALACQPASCTCFAAGHSG